MEKVLIVSYLEPDLVARVEKDFPAVRVIYRPDLLPPPRYISDHTSTQGKLEPGQEAEWAALLGEATVLFDFDHRQPALLPERARNLRWVQATSSGIGTLMQRWNYTELMPNVRFTTARGIHAIPLAEHVLQVLLNHYRRYPHAQNLQAGRSWQRYCASDLAGRKVGILGLGEVGKKVAEYCAALGMVTLGTNRSGQNREAVQKYYPAAEMDAFFRASEILVITLPLTEATRNLVSRGRIGQLPQGAYLINIGRGAVLDEAALGEALRSGHLSGAALDVAGGEPLSPGSPLWDLPNLVITPHSASTSDRENLRLIALFEDNLERYLTRKPLLNLYDPAKGY